MSESEGKQENSPNNGSGSLSFDQTMNKIKQFISESGIMLEDTFHEYDPLRKGQVTSSDFKAALSFIFLGNLTNEEVHLVESRYLVAADSSFCNWPKFLHDAEAATIKEPGETHLVSQKQLLGKVIELAEGKIEFTSLLAQAESMHFESKKKPEFATQTEELLHNLGELIGQSLLKDLKDMYTGDKGFRYIEFLRHTIQGLEIADEAEILITPPVFCIDIPGESLQVPFNSKITNKQFVISYEALVWITFILVTVLCVVDRFVLKGDAVLKRPGKLPERIWGTNIGETITNVIWAVTARVIITSQNLMFYTMLWCFPNIFCEIAPKWVKTEGIRDVNTKIHTFAGIFLIAIPSLAHVLVIFLPPLFDGTDLLYYPGSLNWSQFWDPRAVKGWTFNDHIGVHLTSDEIYRFVLMIVLFCFLFPLSRSHYATHRSYSVAMILHAFGGIWYAVDNIRKATHGLAHFLNLPMLIIWFIDRALSVWVYRRHSGRIVRKDIIGRNDYAVLYIKLDKDVNHAVGDVYYLLHQMRDRQLIPQRSHPFTTFANLSHDTTWDIGFVISIIGAQKQLCVPWTSWLAVDDNTVKFHTWGPYRSSVWKLHNQLMNPSSCNRPSHYILFATGSGCGYILDVLSALAYKPPSQQGSKPVKIDIYYSVRCKAFYDYLRNPINRLLKMITENNSAVVNFHFYVTDQTANPNGDDTQDSHMQFINGRINFEKILKSANADTCCYFVGRPQISKTLENVCKETGVQLVRDYTNGRSKNNDRALMIKYLKISFWMILSIVGTCLVASTVIDIRGIKQLLEMNGLNETVQYQQYQY